MSTDFLKVLVVNDPHISDYPPESRRDKFPDTPLNKVEQVVRIANNYEVDLTLFTGDHFHFKYAERTKYSTTRRYSELLKLIPGQRRTLIGNHDVPYDKPDRWYRQPIAYLIDSKALSFLGDNPDQNDELFVKGDLSLRVKGIHYYKGQDAQDILQVQKGNEDWLLVLTHMDLFPRGSMNYDGPGVVYYDEVAHADADIIANGHIHDDMGVVEIQGTTFLNVGNLLRGSISESDLTRIPQVVMLILTKDEIKCFPIQLEVSPVYEVFEVVKKQTRVMREKEMKEFVKIFGTEEEECEEFDYEREIGALELESPIRRRVEQYIEDAKVKVSE